MIVQCLQTWLFQPSKGTMSIHLLFLYLMHKGQKKNCSQVDKKKSSCIKSVPSSTYMIIVDDDKSKRSVQIKPTNRLLNIHILD